MFDPKKNQKIEQMMKTVNYKDKKVINECLEVEFIFNNYRKTTGTLTMLSIFSIKKIFILFKRLFLIITLKNQKWNLKHYSSSFQILVSIFQWERPDFYYSNSKLLHSMCLKKILTPL